MGKLASGLNAAKIIHYNEWNVSNKSCSELNFLHKSQWAHLSPSTVELGVAKDFVFEINKTFFFFFYF